MNKNAQKFIDSLKALIKEKKLSQTRLAKIMDVDQTTISAWLRGRGEPTLTSICLILEYFDCKFEDLIL